MGNCCQTIVGPLDEGGKFRQLAKEDFEQGQVAAAIWNYERAIEYYQTQYGKNYPEIAQVLLEMVKIYERDLKLHESLACYQRAFDIIFKVNGWRNPKAVEICRKLVSRYWAENRFDEASEHNMDLLQFMIENKGRDDPEVGDLHDTMGSILRDMGQYQDAAHHFIRALDIKKKNDAVDIDVLANEYNKLGLLFLDNLGDVEGAKECFQNVLNMMEDSHGAMHEEVAIAHLNLGSAFLKFKNLQEAKSHVEKSLDIGSKVEWALEITKRQTFELGYLLYAWINEAEGDWMTAAEFEKEWALLHLSEEDCSPYQYVYFSRVLGNLSQEIGESQEAVKFYQQSLDTLEGLHKDEIELGRTYFRMGVAYLDFDSDQADQCLTKALKFFKNSYKDLCDDIIEIVRYQGILKLRKDDFKGGMEDLNRVLEIYNSRYGENDREHIAIIEILFEIGLAYKLFKQYQEAFKYFKKALLMRREPGVSYIRSYSDGEPVTYDIQGVPYTNPDLDRMKDLYYEVFDKEVKRMTTRHEVFGEPRVLPTTEDIEKEIQELEDAGKVPEGTLRSIGVLDRKSLDTPGFNPNNRY